METRLSHRRLRFVLAAWLLALSTPAWALPSVVVDGTEWALPNAVQGFSWNEVAMACPTGGGACTGNLGGIDLTGWSWATAQEVGALFHALTPHPGGIAAYFEAGSTWAPQFIHLMGYTGFDNFPSFAPGFFDEAWSATALSDTVAYLPALFDHIGTTSVEPADAVSTAETALRTARAGGAINGPDLYGVWLFRTPTAVPEPATTALLAGGLLLLVAAGMIRRGNRA
jgi:hypothetical protein